MLHLVLVAFGGALGAILRHLVNLGALRLIGPGVPLGTLFVNVVGSMLMGVLVGSLAERTSEGAQDVRLFLGTGVLGGFTTFSAFSLDTYVLWQDGQVAGASLYVIASVLLSLAALSIGLAFARVFA